MADATAEAIARTRETGELHLWSRSRGELWHKGATSGNTQAVRALRPATEDGVFFAGDSAGHCLPLSGEGIRTAFHFGIAAGREIRTVLAGGPLVDALARYHAFSAAHARAYARFGLLQRLVPALPPWALTLLFRGLSAQPVVDRAFAWYLAQAPPPAPAAS